MKKHRTTCYHCGKGHKEDQCWTLLLELLLEKFKNKRKKSAIVIVQHDLRFYSRDESLIIAMGFKGMPFSSSSSSIQKCIYSKLILHSIIVMHFTSFKIHL